MIRWLTGTALTALAAVLVLDGSSTQAAPSRCDPQGSRQLARNQYARVYTARRFNGMTGTFGRATFYCTYATGEISGLDLPEARIYFGPALHLNGRWLGYAQDICPIDFDPSSNGLPCRTYVHSENVTTVPPGHERQSSGALAVPGVDPDTPTLDESLGLARVGSLRVRGRAIAFIACPSSKRSPRERTLPNCTKPGTFSRVLVLPTGVTELQTLDQGRQIAPDSLRLSASQLTWRHNGRRRTTTLR